MLIECNNDKVHMASSVTCVSFLKIIQGVSHSRSTLRRSRLPESILPRYILCSIALVSVLRTAVDKNRHPRVTYAFSAPEESALTFYNHYVFVWVSSVNAAGFRFGGRLRRCHVFDLD